MTGVNRAGGVALVSRGFADVAAAVRFLTILPLPAAPAKGTAGEGAGRSDRAGASTAWFPLVGLLLGGVLAAVGAALPGDGLLAAALVLVVWSILTGGLHEDGWADCFDAALPPVSRERRLEILRDPLIGAHGLLAVVLLIVVRLGAIADAPVWGFAVAPVVGRWAMVVSLAAAPPLRREGLGAAYAPAARPWAASAVALAALGLVVWWAGTGESGSRPDGASGVDAVVAATVVALAAAAASGAGLGVFLARRFGGLSGDGHGAVGLAAETAALCALALWPGGATVGAGS